MTLGGREVYLNAEKIEADNGTVLISLDRSKLEEKVDEVVKERRTVVFYFVIGFVVLLISLNAILLWWYLRK